jgi:glyoxylase-like metal-dependent hydrolase (beta-lactamase superfamily II)
MVLLSAILLAAALPAKAVETDYDKIEIKVSKVAGSVYLLQGTGGNMAASVGADGVILVDDEFAPLAPKIAAALKSLGITDKPVSYVINTHFHFDHTGGNLPMANGGSTIIAHDNVRARLASGGDMGTGGSIHRTMPAAPPGALPVITFDHDVSVHLNGEDVRALHYPAGHTDGDSIIFFPKANVVHMGDDYVRYGFPFIDVEAGGSLQGMINACEGVIERVPPDAKLIPGHGELSTIAELREYVQMLKDTRDVVARALKAGKTLEQLKTEMVLARWSARYSGDFISTDTYLETVVYSLQHYGHTPFVRHN